MPAEKKSQKNIIYPKVKLKDILSAFWQGIKPQRWWMFSSVFSIIFANIITVIIPIFYKQFFDVITAGGDTAKIAATLLKIIIEIGVLNGIMWLFYRVFTFSLTHLRWTP